MFFLSSIDFILVVNIYTYVLCIYVYSYMVSNSIIKRIFLKYS